MYCDAHTIYLICDCNLACRYCYEKNKKKDKILIENIDIIINRIQSLSDSNFILELFGGEPILNWPAVEYFLDFFKHDPYAYSTIVTNGTLLTLNKIKKLSYYGAHVRISYDGKHGHDFCRVTKRMQGTENKVRNSIIMSIAEGLNFGINCAVHKYNENKLISDIEDLLQLGVKNIWIYPVKRADFAPKNFKKKYSIIKEIALKYGAVIGSGSQKKIKKKYLHTTSWYKCVPGSGCGWKDEAWPA